MAIDRKQMQGQLKKRIEEQNKAKDRGVNDYESYFSVPEGVFQYTVKPTEAGIEIGFDIIPFMAGSNYPTKDYNINEGDLTYILDIWIHRNVGAANKPVVCPLKNYDLPCPICEKRVEMLDEQGQMEKEAFKKFKKDNAELWPSRRVLYNVIIRHDEKEEKKGIQILENSHFFFEKKMQEVAKRPRGGGLIPYPDPDEGKTVWMNLKKAGDNWEVTPPAFEDRKYIISDEEIEAAHALDNLLALHDYDKIVQIMSITKGKTEDNDNNVEEKPVVNRRELKAPVQEVKQESSMGDDVPTFEENCVNTETGEMKCPIEAEFGVDFDNYEECDKCAINMECKIANEPPVQEPEPEPVTPVRRKRTLKS